MTIYITGATGKVGTLICNQLSSKLELRTLGRHDSDTSWCLGEIPLLIKIQPSDILIHAAWSLQDRVGDCHTNVGGSVQLINLFLENGAKVLFVSSIAAKSKSSYGRQKLAVENEVKKLGCSIVRPGLILENNRHESRKLFKLIGIKGNLECTSSADVLTFIDDFIANPTKGIVVELITEVKPANQVLGKSLINIKPRFLHFKEKPLYVRSVKINNYLDAMYSLVLK